MDITMPRSLHNTSGYKNCFIDVSKILNLDLFVHINQAISAKINTSVALNDVNFLRAHLLTILKTDNQPNRFDDAMYKVVYRALVHLAKHYPLNKDGNCPLLLEPVAFENRIYVSRGEFYDKAALHSHIVKKGYKNPLDEGCFSHTESMFLSGKSSLYNLNSSTHVRQSLSRGLARGTLLGACVGFPIVLIGAFAAPAAAALAVMMVGFGVIPVATAGGGIMGCMDAGDTSNQRRSAYPRSLSGLLEIQFPIEIKRIILPPLSEHTSLLASKDKKNSYGATQLVQTQCLIITNEEKKSDGANKIGLNSRLG